MSRSICFAIERARIVDHRRESAVRHIVEPARGGIGPQQRLRRHDDERNRDRRARLHA